MGETNGDRGSLPALTRRGFLSGATLAAVGLAVGCSSDDTDSTALASPGDPTTTTTSPSSTASSTTTTEAETPTGSTADSAGREWAVYGHDPAQTRTNVAERAITRTTVADLEPGWEIADLVGVTGTPLLVDGVAYFADWKGQVWAVDAASGDPVWTTQVGGFIVGACALDGDAVFASSGSSVFRLHRRTGKLEWTARTDEHPQAQINASPVVVDGLVLQGTASFENMLALDEYLFRGSIAAFDAENGKLRWQFFATEGDEESGPGAGIWSTPAVDAERGMLYVGTGQGLAEPTPKMADSLLAIDYRTGELAWSTQFTYPDVFSASNPTGKDADVGASPNLWTSDGRDLVGAGDKGGTYHALDRETGEVVWQTQLTPGSAFGGEIGSAAFVDGLLIATSNVGDPATNAPTDRTKVFGLDPATGEKRWSSDEMDGKIFGPVSAVPGVAFVGTDRARLLAFHTETGEELWATDAAGPVACGPSIVDGRLLWGYGFTLFGAPGPGGVLSFTLGEDR